MKEQDRADELINRYVHEVGRRLPEAERTDVQDELRSLLEEALESRVSEQGAPRNESTAAEVLRDFGHPSEVADRYLPRPRYLIGPQLYPSFLLTLKVVLPAMVGIALLVTLLQGAWWGPSETRALGTGLPRWLALSVQMVIAALGNLVLIFAILERLDQKTATRPHAWNPLKLPPVGEENRVSITRVVLKMYAIIFLATVFNFFPGWLGIFISVDDSRTFVSAEQLGIVLPAVMLNVWWIIAFGKNLVLALRRRWTPLTRWLDIGLSAFAVVILVAMLRAFWATPWDREMIIRLGGQALCVTLEHGIQSILAISAVVVLIGVLVKGYGLLAGSGSKAVHE